MEFNINGTENNLSSHILEIENHNYFQIGLEPVSTIVENDIQIPSDGVYHTLTLAPIEIVYVDTGKTMSVHLEEEEQRNKKYLNVKGKEKSDVKTPDTKETVKENGLISQYEEHLDTKLKKSCKDDATDDEDIIQINYTCNECSYNTNKKYMLTRHERVHSEDRPHKCNVCERGFKTEWSMQVHRNTHYGVKNKVCKYCNKSFTTSGAMVRHVKYKHTQEKPHKCTQCNYASVERSKLQRHMRFHAGDRPYQCQHCTYASCCVSHLTRHSRSHTGEKPYKCKECNAAYAYSTSLKLHVLVHNPSGNKQYSCDQCPIKMSRKCELRRHKSRMHDSVKPVKCERCDETFSDRYLYRLHKKNHEFKCQLCSYATKRFLQLKKHMKKHTGEKSIDVDQSLITVQFLRNLHRDKDTESKKKSYECQKCKRTFVYKGCLTRHEALHDTTYSSAKK